MFRKLLLVLFIVMVSFLFLPNEAAAAGCEVASLVFSEVDYSILGAEDSEFVELYFVADANITNCELRSINDGAGDLIFATADLTGNYSAGDLLVIGNVPAATISLMSGGAVCTDDCLDNGPRDGIALVDTSSETVMAAISWEGNFEYLGFTSTNISADSGCEEPGGTGSPDPTGSCQNGPIAGNGDWYYADPTPGAVGPTAVTMSGFNASAASGLAQVLGLSFVLLALTGIAGWMLKRGQHT